MKNPRFGMDKAAVPFKRLATGLGCALIGVAVFGGLWARSVHANLPARDLHRAPHARHMADLRKILPHPPAFRPPGGSGDLAALGQRLFFDTTLSTPEGQACASCHAPQAGFRFPDSKINEQFGVATGAIPTRVGSRSVPTVSYAAFIPHGPPSAHLDGNMAGGERVFIGGIFWDGRAIDLEHQATFPLQDPNEMNNLVHNLGSPVLVVKKLISGPNADFFRAVFGNDVFAQPTEVVFAKLTQAIAAYERTPKVSPFTSKFDLYLAGRIELSPEELDGFRLMTGTVDGRSDGKPYRKNAQCTACHGIPDSTIEGPFLWTNFCYANIGVPKNPNNPFYDQTDPNNNPSGYNPQGREFIDYGLGDFIYPLNGLPVGNVGEGSDGYGDYLQANGAFKAPTLRNLDKRPAPDFVKPYMHNGVFKSIKEVVHFYNMRNLTTVPGEVIDFTTEDPYAGLQGVPLFPRPEIAGISIANPTGAAGEDGGMIGNLGLTDEEEDHIVAFLQTMTDGYFEPEPPRILVQPVSATVSVNGVVSFTVQASGAPSPSYRWYKGATPLDDFAYTSGSATPTLTINPVRRGDAAADYHCVVTNTAGSVSSDAVSLNISLHVSRP